MTTELPNNDNLPEAPAAPSRPPLEVTQPAAGNALVLGPLQGLLLAALAGFVIWAILEAILPVFLMPDHLRNVAGNVPPELLTELREVSVAVRSKNAGVALILMGAVLALTLTVAESLLRRRTARAAWGGLLAALVAAGAAVGATVLGAVLMGALRFDDNPLMKTLLLQGAMLGTLGMGIGIAVSLPIYRPKLLANCLVGGLLGGLLAALLYPMIVSLLPNVNTEGLIPDRGVGRLLWAALACGAIGAAMAGVGKEKPKAAAEAPPSQAA